MHYASFIKASALLHFIILVLGHPLRQEQKAQPAQLLRRASYSVVAVDGGSVATTSISSLIETTTCTTSQTRTIDKTKTISFTPTLPTISTVTRSTTLSKTLNGCDTSTVVTPSSRTSTPQSPVATTALQPYITIGITHGTFPVPVSQSFGEGARYSASRPWNSTLTSNYGPTGTSSSAGSIVTDSRGSVP